MSPNHKANRRFTATGTRMLRACIALIACFALAASSTVHAQDATAQTVTKDMLRETYLQMLQRPSDINITMKYAEQAVALGDYEAAIPPLERVLMFNPELPEVKVQLGVMYFNLNSKDVARNYFEDALDDAGLGDDDAARARSYLNQTAQKQ